MADNDMQKMVREFHVAKGHPSATGPVELTGERAEFRRRLIREEAEELSDALVDGDMVKAIDGICDLVYVALGTAVEMGVNIVPYFAEVHRSNMTKSPQQKEADSKVSKGDRYSPPAIEEMLRNELLARSKQLELMYEANARGGSQPDQWVNKTTNDLNLIMAKEY